MPHRESERGPMESTELAFAPRWSNVGDVLQTVLVRQSVKTEIWTEPWPGRPRDCRFSTAVGMSPVAMGRFYKRKF